VAADPGNIELGLAYAANLQAMGQVDDMIKVLDEVARRNPDDAKLQAYYGKQLTHHGRAAAGERILQRLVDSGHADWRVHSALGSALDQQGKFIPARGQYDTALKSGAKKLTVLNNIGMSYMLEGNVKAAEDTLRQASAFPAATSNRACARTWPWPWACRAASRKPATSPAATCRRTPSMPTWPICAPCCPSPTPGKSSSRPLARDLGHDSGGLWGMSCR
jgi:tetratricopeptide (TPR) repeat protein